MTSDSQSNVTPGQVLAGKFRIEEVLGRGGMGVVVAVTHLQLDQKVALKFLLPEALANPEAVQRFEREARAAVRIRSEHVARVTDVGTLENRAPFMVMEFLDGMDLGPYLEMSASATLPPSPPPSLLGAAPMDVVPLLGSGRSSGWRRQSTPAGVAKPSTPRCQELASPPHSPRTEQR